MLFIERLAPADWPLLAGFIHRHNRRADGSVRCLHAEHGQSEQDHADELRGLAPGEACFIVARSPLGVAGLIGAEVDAALRRAWLRGPLLADAAQPQAAALRADLIAALQRALPQVACFDAFPQADEAVLVESYRAAGFEPLLCHHAMRLDAPAAVPPWPAAVHDASQAPAASAHARQAAELHAALFADTYLSPAALLDTRDADHRLFIAVQADEAVGYTYAQYKPFDREVYIDFIGVAPHARGSGFGRSLLDAAVHWAFGLRGASQVSLTVRSDRAPARGLYEAAGFRTVASGLHLRWQRPRD